ncbi:polysaccharide deacetylase family protein [Terrisporobacter vanillatitrophus]|uniref:polysaccharide deacetylase family protein n=1 Tax=Terrisporobacter vanillatitrophus TaxID=3058402 RepID=UPI00336841EE
MKKIIFSILCMLIITTGCSKKSDIREDSIQENNIKADTSQIEKDTKEKNEEDKIKGIIKAYENVEPKEWGEHLKGVVSHIDDKNKEIALTLDACGGKQGSKYDKEIINFLDKENIPATLFINYRWIEDNKDIFINLSKNNNFEIENHGYSHKPLSVNKKSIYNIEGTSNVEDVIKEIKLNEDEIYKLTGKKPKYFRSGTAYYDEVSIKIAEKLGYKIAGFSINGDGGATFSKEEVINEVSKSKAGDIIISHFNQPNGYTYEGLKEALIKLRKEGYEFVKLDE